MFFINIIIIFSLIVSITVSAKQIKNQIPSKRKDTYLYIFMILLPILIGFVITYFHPEPPIKKKETIQRKLTTKDSIFISHTEQQLQDSVELDFIKPEKHLIYIEKHFVDFKKKYDAHLIEVYEPHARMKNYYAYKSESEDTNYSINSKWAAGVIFYYEHEPDSCIKILQHFRYKPYSNLLMALAFEEKSANDSAAKYFLAEYIVRPQLLPDSSKKHLISTVIKSEITDQITIQSCYLPGLSNLVPEYIRREVYFVLHDWVNYAKVYLEAELRNILTYDFLVSFLVIGMWLVYLIQLDIFQRESGKYIAFTILASAIISTTVPFVYEYFDYIHHWDLTGNSMDDFLFCVFGIGLFEETAKALPLLFLILFTKEPDESFDYIFYASLSALGFALMENAMYFHIYGGTTIIARAFTSTIAHVFFCSVFGYGLFIANHFKKNKIIYGLFFLFLAMLSHGIYDWLLFYGWYFIFYIGFFASIMVWFIFVNNTLNASSKFNMFAKIDYKKIEFLFMLFVALILISQYLVDQFYTKSDEALRQLWSSILFSLFFLLFFVNRIGKMDLVQGHFQKISLIDRYNATGNNNLFDIRVLFVNFFVVNAIQPMNYFGLNVRIFHNRLIANNALSVDHELNGTIMERAKVITQLNSGKVFIDTHYFWVHLEKLISTGSYTTNSILLKQIDGFETVENGLPINVSVIGLKLQDGIVPNTIDVSDTYFIGYALVQLVE